MTNWREYFEVLAHHYSKKESALNEPTKTEAIHPAPYEFLPEEITNYPILRFFHYKHLPIVLQARSEPFCRLARMIIDTLPSNAERAAALRKLLEAKDCAVRAAI